MSKGSAIATVISTIASGLFALLNLDSLAGSATSANKNTVNNELIRQLSTKIASDSKLAQDLVDAFERKDQNLARDLLYASPFGSAYAKISKAAKTNEDDLQTAKKYASEVNAVGQKAMNDILANPSGSGSLIGDMISGGATSPEYQIKTDITEISKKVK